MKLPFNNRKGVIVAILCLILLFISYGVFATEVEVGPTFAGEFNDGMGLVLTERVADGKIDLGMAIIGEQNYAKENLILENNGNFFAVFCQTKPKSWFVLFPADVCIGGAYWIHTSRFIGDELGFHLALKWRIGEHASINLRHWSNAGTVKPNRGQDLLTFGWRF